MRRALVIVWVGALLLGACGGDKGNASAASTSGPSGAPFVIKTRLIVAAEPGAEPIATGEVLEGSTLGGDPFCAGGTILDTHGVADFVETYGLIDRTITCPEGTVRIGLTPEVGPDGPTGKGSWTVASGTGVYEGLRGGGQLQVAEDPEDPSVERETLTGTVTS
jgi:hypothetical protein